ncbi:MAG: AlpA family phage regulatory protein [Acidovorax sp.]|nr:AlpA family phage regulatory protein [Acidovorax sp.]
MAPKPGALDLVNAALYVALSVSTVQKLVREGDFPLPRKLSGRRVGFLVPEIDEWLEARPVSQLLPPPNTGHSNRPGVAPQHAQPLAQ